jgi:methionyl-tRNA formyltransferase
MESGALVSRSQAEELATVWSGRRPEDGRLDPAMRVIEADRLVRAVTRPYPGAFIDVQGRRLRVWEAHEVGEAQLGKATGPTLPFQDGWLSVTQSAWEPIA